MTATATRMAAGWVIASLVLNLAILCPQCPGLAFGRVTCMERPPDCPTAVSCDAASCCVNEPMPEPDTPGPDPVPLSCLLLCLQYCIGEDEVRADDLPPAGDLVLPTPRVIVTACAAAARVTLRPSSRGSPARAGPLQPLLCVWRN